jgi:peptide deformylase
MAILPLVINDDPRLRKVSEPVVKITKEIKKLISNMQVTMRKHRGMGLAAVQVGSLYRIIIIEYTPHEKESKREKIPFQVLINPEIYWKSKDEWGMDEGCLSCPGLRGPVIRSMTIKVKALSDQGKPFEFRATGLKARIIQHEVDHCDGILFIDFVPDELLEKVTN